MSASTGFVGLVPDCVRTVLVDQELMPTRKWRREEAAVGEATAARRAEYQTTRECARAALQELGFPAIEIPTGPDRGPVWPAGVVGSLTHCARIRAAAVARAVDLRALGIDIEMSKRLPPRVLEVIATEEEVGILRRLDRSNPSVPWERVLFSAKEAVFKAWFPLTSEWIDYRSCCLDIDPLSGSFVTTFDATSGRGNTLSAEDVLGRWRVYDGFVFTVAYVARS